MTAYEVNRSTTNTLTSTTADTITLTQLWGSVRVTNQHTSNWLYATPGGETAVAEADGTVAIPPGQSRTFKAERAEGTNTVVVGVVGNGNVYTVEGMQGTLDEALDDLTAEVDTLANVTSGPIVLAAADFYESSGAPTYNEAPPNRESGWALDAATNERVAARFWLPAGWSNVKVTLRFANAGTGTGAYGTRTLGAVIAPGSSVNDFPPNMGLVTTTAAAQWIEQEVVAATSYAGFTAGALNRLWIDRLASDAADTLANDVVFYAAILEKA